jgi:hypothetical protein
MKEKKYEKNYYSITIGNKGSFFFARLKYRKFKEFDQFD